ncbi:MAG: hypothetical protein L6R39_005010 [Caloplaca ligustica]|nr:MAG: hypothetical protein L6R39_005010 [Caloplaca ligustica]
MTATTLVAFFLRLPTSVWTVDLLGSWDNFKEPYPLQKDRQAGPGHWRGCHSFKNIICDGKSLDASASRQGGLKMGGTYWYFYRLNDDREEHDPLKPSTTACPLLPGQQVNVLEVPVQLPDGNVKDRHSQTLLESIVFTLDPKAKYNSPKPSTDRYLRWEVSGNLSATSTNSRPTSWNQPKTHLLECSTASATTLQPLKRTRPKTSQGPCIPFPKASSIMAIFHKLRGTRSAPSTSRCLPDERPRSSRPPWELEQGNNRADHSSFKNAKDSINTPEWPLADTQRDQIIPWTADPSIAQSAQGRISLTARSHRSFGQETQTASHSRLSAESFGCPIGEQGPRALEANSRSPSSHDSRSHESSVLPKPIAATPSNTTSSINTGDEPADEQGISQWSSIEEDCLETVRRGASPLVLPIQSNVPSLEASQNEQTVVAHSKGLERARRPLSLLHDARETLKTFYAASSSYDGQLSPHYLSQPESPSVRDFEEVWESESQTQVGSQDLTPEDPPLLGGKSKIVGFDLFQTRQAPSPSFQGYSLPQEDHASTLTLRKPANAVFPPTQDQSQNDHLVQSWNDGSGHPHLTASDGLADDLGYLGQVIA